MQLMKRCCRDPAESRHITRAGQPPNGTSWISAVPFQGGRSTPAPPPALPGLARARIPLCEVLCLPSHVSDGVVITCTPLRPCEQLLTLASGRRVAPGRSAVPAEAGQPLAAHQLVPILAPVHEHRAQGDARASVHVVESIAWWDECHARCWGEGRTSSAGDDKAPAGHAPENASGPCVTPAGPTSL